MPRTSGAPLLVASAFAALAGLALAGASPAMAASSGEEPASVLLIRAKTALDDGLAPLAETLARAVHDSKTASQGERNSAFDILFQSMSAGKPPEEVLASVDSGAVDGIPIPPDGRAALWRSDALLALGRADEAVETLRGALPMAAPGPAARIRRRIPSALLASGATNEALTAYSALEAELIRVGSPEAPVLARDRARILHATGRDEDAAEALAQAMALPMPPDQFAAMRMLHADVLLDTAPDEAAALLREAADDLRLANRPYRSGALLRLAELEGASSPSNAVLLATQAAEAATDAESRFAGWALAAELCCRDALPNAASNYFHQALSAPPPTPADHDALLRRCADALLGAGATDAALGFYDELATRATSPESEFEGLFGRGRCLLLQGRLDTAVVAFNRAVELAPPRQRGTALFRAAQAMHSAGDLARAAEAFARAADPDAGLDDALRTRAAFLRADCLASSDPDSGVAAFRAFAEAHPGTRDAAIARLEIARLAGPADVSRTSAEAVAAARAAGDPEILCAALIAEAMVAARAYSFSTALADLDEAVETGASRAPEARYLRVFALFNLGRETEAVESCQAICDDESSGPWRADSTLWLGKFSFNAGHYAEAAERLVAFADEWPDRREVPDALLTAARAMLAAKRWEAAAAAAARLVALSPEPGHAAAARKIQGEALHEQMRFEEAILVFDDIIRSWPGTADARDALLLKGTCLFALGNEDPSRYAAAEECFRELLPDAGFAESSQLNYRIGRCRERVGDVKGAYETYYGNVLAYQAPSHPVPAGALSDAATWYTRSLLNAADIAATHEEHGGVATATKLLEKLAHSDLPGHAKAEEALRRLHENPQPRPMP